MPAFIVLKTVTIIGKTLRPTHLTKTFLAECKSIMELEIIYKKPIAKLHTATTSAKPLTYSNVSTKSDGAIIFTERTNMLIRSTLNSK